MFLAPFGISTFLLLPGFSPDRSPKEGRETKRLMRCREQEEWLSELF
jgi:hypothetical protein